MSAQTHLSYNGEDISLPTGGLSTWQSEEEGKGIKVERTSAVNNIIVTLPGVVEILVNVVPITAEDDKIHGYKVPSDDCFAHLEVQFRFSGLSDDVDDVELRYRLLELWHIYFLLFRFFFRASFGFFVIIFIVSVHWFYRASCGFFVSILIDSVYWFHRALKFWTKKYFGDNSVTRKAEHQVRVDLRYHFLEFKLT